MTEQEVHELWVGDYVRLVKSGRIGRFAKYQAGKIYVEVDDKLIKTVPKLVEYMGDLPTETKEDVAEDSIVQTARSHHYSSTIDLHIEKLNPSLANALPERIVAYQVEAAKKFIEAAKAQHLQVIEIIHGKGTGVLKHEVLHLLSLYPEVDSCKEINAGGGTEIILLVK